MAQLNDHNVYLLRTDIDTDVAAFATYHTLALEALRALDFSLPESGKITIKPNATVLYNADVRVVTHPGFVAGIVDYLFERGVSAERLLVADGQSGENPDEDFTWKGAGYVDMVEKRGVILKCLNDEPTEIVGVANGVVYHSYPIYSDITDCSFLFNVPVAKCHNLGCTTLSIKNLMGVLGRPERHLCATQEIDESLGDDLWRLTDTGLSLFEDRFYHKLCDLIVAVRSMGMPRLCVIDGLVGRDGTAFNEGRNYPLGWTLVGVNEVNVDAVGTYLMGLDPTVTPYLRVANERGLGNSDIRDIKVIDLTKGDTLTEAQLAQIRRQEPLMPVCRSEDGYYNRFRSNGSVVPWQIDKINEQRRADGKCEIVAR